MVRRLVLRPVKVNVTLGGRGLFTCNMTSFSEATVRGACMTWFIARGAVLPFFAGGKYPGSA